MTPLTSKLKSIIPLNIDPSKKDDDYISSSSSSTWKRVFILLLLVAAGLLFFFFLCRYLWWSSGSPELTSEGKGWADQFNQSRVYVLGDSTVASGNFDITPRPYGIDRPSSGGGRFSNGYVIGDFIALENNSPIPEAYITLGKAKKSAAGVNFASGGCGLLDETRPPVPTLTCLSLSEQLQRVLSLPLDYLTALFVISAGGNDYMFSFKGKGKGKDAEDPKAFAKKLVRQLKSTVLSLYARGVKKFLINNIGPAGCIPNKRSRATKKCDTDLNDAIAEYNFLLNQEFKEFTKEATIVIADSHQLFTAILESPYHYGFSVIDKPCCGGWNADLKMYLCDNKIRWCENREHTLFFDGAHTTDRANEVFARECFSGKICAQII